MVIDLVKGGGLAAAIIYNGRQLEQVSRTFPAQVLRATEFLGSERKHLGTASKNQCDPSKRGSWLKGGARVLYSRTRG